MGGLSVHRTGRAAALGIVALVALAAPVHAQDRERLRERCVEGGPGGPGESACQATALAVEALLGGVGLSFSGGNDLPGSPSTLGRRFGSAPRWAVSGRAGFTQFDVPSLSADDPGASRGVWAPALQAELAAGVFEGFRLAPTVGGFLSLDLLAVAGVSFLPGGEGFDRSARGWGYGARLGVLRESFSLPAVTLSASRRHVSDFRYGEEGAPGAAVERLTVTSYRATAGKEFVALGVLAGFGVDRVGGDGTARAPGVGAAELAFDDLSASRFLIFGALTKTWLVLQASVEAGFASGYEERADATTAGGYDPTGGSFFGGLSFRLIY